MCHLKFSICVRCDIAFIEPMHRNKPNITCLLSVHLSMKFGFHSRKQIVGGFGKKTFHEKGKHLFGIEPIPWWRPTLSNSETWHKETTFGLHNVFTYDHTNPGISLLLTKTDALDNFQIQYKTQFSSSDTVYAIAWCKIVWAAFLFI